MEYSVEDILNKLNSKQLHALIALYGLEKPHSKSTKSDLLNYIDSIKNKLDTKMLVNYFELKLKPIKIVNKDLSESIELSGSRESKIPRIRKETIQIKEPRQPKASVLNNDIKPVRKAGSKKIISNIPKSKTTKSYESESD